MFHVTATCTFLAVFGIDSHLKVDLLLRRAPARAHGAGLRAQMLSRGVQQAPILVLQKVCRRWTRDDAVPDMTVIQIAKNSMEQRTALVSDGGAALTCRVSCQLWPSKGKVWQGVRYSSSQFPCLSLVVAVCSPPIRDGRHLRRGGKKEQWGVECTDPPNIVRVYGAPQRN